jgi:hypothetical protein
VKNTKYIKDLAWQSMWAGRQEVNEYAHTATDSTPHVLPIIAMRQSIFSSSSSHFQLRPASGLQGRTSQAPLEHTQATTHFPSSTSGTPTHTNTRQTPGSGSVHLTPLDACSTRHGLQALCDGLQLLVLVQPRQVCRGHDMADVVQHAVRASPHVHQQQACRPVRARRGR